MRRHRVRLFLLLPILALVFGLVLFALHLAERPFQALIDQGDEHARLGERTAAVVAYQEAALLRPDDPLPHLRLAQVYLDWGRPAEVLAVLSAAERLGAGGPSDPSVRQMQLAAYVAQGDWVAVVDLAGEADITPLLDRDERHDLARACVELGEWDVAQDVYRALLADDEDDRMAHERLGILLLGDDPEAFQHLYAARTILSNSLLTVLNEPGVAEDPAYASGLVGEVLFEAGEWSLAVRQFERAISFSPDYSSAHAYLGYALDAMGRSVEAGVHLRQAVELAPDSVLARTFLGLHLRRMDDITAARAEFEAAYDLDPLNPATCVEIGETWAAEGRYVAAEIWLREAVSLAPGDPVLWEILTRFYLDHNLSTSGEALEAAEALLALAPDDPASHDLHGWAALQMGNDELAEESLLRALALDSSLASAHYHLGLVYRLRGDQVAAQEAFARALDLDTIGDLTPLIERAMAGAMP